MAILPTEIPCDVPVLREGHPSQGVRQGQICYRGAFRADCQFFAVGGPDECYDCGYRDGLDDGKTLVTQEYEQLLEDHYEGMD